MSESEFSSYLYKLKDETEKIERRFACLVHDLKMDMEKTSKLKDVLIVLSNFGSKDRNFESLLKDCPNLAEVFIRISKFISFFDYGLIKLLAHKFGSSSSKKKLKKYKQKFQEYAKHRVCQCPSSAFSDASQTSETVYAIKTEKDINTLTLEELGKLQYEMNKILGHKLLRLLHIKEGCVELIFRTLEDDEFSVSEEQKQDLRKLGVLNINYGDIHVVVTNPAEVANTSGS